jgi:uncharacterized membrane protein YdbT with pleckstrin-like domain
MAFPVRLLHADEEVFLDQHPHGIRLVAPVTLSALVVAGVIAGFVEWKAAPTWFGIVLGVVVLTTAIYLGARVLAWRATSFVVTSHRVIYRTGVLRRSGREIPIDALQSVSYRQSLAGRIVGVGSLLVSSAGQDDAQEVPDVRDPEAAQSAVQEAIEANAHRRGAPKEETSDITTELERLEGLYHRGVITAAELERVKRDLLKPS